MSNPFFKTREETKAWLDAMRVKGYTIRDDLTVDVSGGVDIGDRKLKDSPSLPVQFGVVTGDFRCSNNSLTSLVGAPLECMAFYCTNNQLTSLNGSPAVCDDFYGGFNQLTSLIGAPKKCKTFICTNNKLTTLVGAPTDCTSFVCSKNLLISLEGVSKNCPKIQCRHNPILADVSAAADGCELICDHDVVAKNQAARHLTELNIAECENKPSQPATPKRSL